MYFYEDNIAEKLRNNNATLYNGKFTRDTVNELLANEWNSKAGIEKNVSAYDLIQENKNLSTEEKVDKIHEVADKRNQEIESIATSPVNIAKDAVVENESLGKSTIKNVLFGGFLGGLNKGGYKLANKIDTGKILRKAGQKNKLLPRQQRELQDKAIQYYEDYLEGRSVKLNDGSKVKFGSPNGIRIKPKNANIIPDLPDQLKSGEIINQDNKTSVHNKLKGKIYNYSINKNINGENTIGKINSAQKNKEEEEYFWLRELLNSLKRHT